MRLLQLRWQPHQSAVISPPRLSAIRGVVIKDAHEEEEDFRFSKSRLQAF